MSKYLIDEYPLIVLPTLAMKIGLNEAIFLQQVNYWLARSKHQEDGRMWIYNSFEEWQKQLPFWPVVTIKRIVKSLRDMGILITTSKYNKMPMDRTLWYTIDFAMLDSIIMDSASYQNDTIIVSNGDDDKSQNDTSNNQILLPDTNADKGGMDARRSLPDEPVKLPAPPTAISQSKSTTGDPYMDAAVNRAKQRQADGGIKKAQRAGGWAELDAKVPASVRLPLVERLIDIHGLRAIVDMAGDDAKLNDMHALATDLYVMGFTTLADIEAVYEQFKKEWKGKTPGGRQLATIASAMKQEVAQPTSQQPTKQPVDFKRWLLNTYTVDNPKFLDIPRAVLDERYARYQQQHQQTH